MLLRIVVLATGHALSAAAALDSRARSYRARPPSHGGARGSSAVEDVETFAPIARRGVATAAALDEAIQRG